MGKKVEGWTRGVGPYSGTSDIKLRHVPMTKDAEGRRDISRVVDKNTEGESGNHGFPAPLKPNRE